MGTYPVPVTITTTVLSYLGYLVAGHLFVVSGVRDACCAGVGHSQGAGNVLLRNLPCTRRGEHIHKDLQAGA
jgi:NhaP-type Na+/H+ or K+/H+ antiporter